MSTSNSCADDATYSGKKGYSSPADITSCTERLLTITRDTKTTITFRTNIRAPPGFEDINPDPIMIPRTVVSKKAEDHRHLKAVSCPPKLELPCLGVGNVLSKGSIANLRYSGYKNRRSIIDVGIRFPDYATGNQQQPSSQALTRVSTDAPNARGKINT